MVKQTNNNTKKLKGKENEEYRAAKFLPVGQDALVVTELAHSKTNQILNKDLPKL